MRTKTQFSRAKALAAITTMVATLAGAQQLPDDDAIEHEAAKQAPRSAAAITKAEREAKLLRQVVPDTGSAVASPDPADIAKRYEAAPTSEPGLFVLVSLSMPASSLDRLAAQAAKARGTLVLRGVVDNSLKKTAELTAEVLRRHPGAQFQIDPTLFRRFGVEQVPAFVLSARREDDGTCGKDCDANSTFVRVAGDVSLDYALEYLSRQRDPRFSALAESRLRMLRSQP